MPALKKILIVGASSLIAQETAKLFAAKGASLFLAARSAETLQRLAADLTVRGASSVEIFLFDALDEASIHRTVETALSKMPDLDAVLIAHGTLPDQHRCETEPEELKNALTVNFVSAVLILHLLAPHFEKRKSGVMAAISSVAGERGRQSNYVYGAAKGGLSLFMQGLRNRLAPSGVAVLTIKPGFVDTPMTDGLQKGFLFASAARVAKGIVSAMEQRKDVVYLPFFWRHIMLVVKLIPERFFKRLKL